MSGLEFVVEFTKAYAQILMTVCWPLVVLVIFFTVLYYFNRTVGGNRPSKRLPLTWTKLNNLLVQLEKQHLDRFSETANPQREMLVRNQLHRARQAIENRNENEVLESIAALSVLALHGDDRIDLIQLQDKIHETEIILPPPKDE